MEYLIYAPAAGAAVAVITAFIAAIRFFIRWRHHVEINIEGFRFKLPPQIGNINTQIQEQENRRRIQEISSIQYYFVIKITNNAHEILENSSLSFRGEAVFATVTKHGKSEIIDLSTLPISLGDILPDEDVTVEIWFRYFVERVIRFKIRKQFRLISKKDIRKKYKLHLESDPIFYDIIYIRNRAW